MFSITTLSKYIPILLLLTVIACQSDPPPTEKSKKPSYTPSGNELFSKLDPAKSGVDFTNRIIEDHELNIISNSYMYNGGGVAIIDLNNDDLPDLYFSSSQESNRLYLNKGSLTFEDITESAGVGAVDGFKTGVTAVDINADGWMDLYVCRTGLTDSPARANLLFINQKDNTFKEEAAAYGLNIRTPSNQANFFDYDLDGDLDMYLLNHPTDFKSVNNVQVDLVDGKRVRNDQPKNPEESDRLYRNEGNGQFTNVSTEAGIVNRAFGLSVTSADINEDGYPDLFIGNDYIEPDFVYINKRNGTFEDQTNTFLRHMSNHTMGVDIADFNNDLKEDIIALDMIAEDNRRQKLLMTTMMLERYSTLVEYGYGHQIMRNVLQLNSGNGTFSEIGTYSGISNTDWSWSALFADLDNDGWKDIYITNGYRRDVTNMDYLTYTVDSINQNGGITKSKFPDFNSFLDLIPSEKIQNYAYRNKADLSFEKSSNVWGFVESSFSNGAAYADLDNDGDLEIITNNIDDPAFIYVNKTRERNGGNYVQISLQGTENNPMGIGAKVRIETAAGSQLQAVTPTRGFFSSVQTTLHFGLADASTVDQIEVSWPDGKKHLIEGQTANQKLVIKHKDANGNSINSGTANSTPLFRKANGPAFTHQENAFEDFNRERLLPHRLSRLGPFIAEGDVDGNGQTDFFIGNAAGKSAALYLQQNGRFVKKEGPWETQFEDLGALFFDADGDSDLDLYVVSGGNANAADSELYQDRLYLNDGRGNFSRTANSVPRLISSGSCVQAHDYDQDGDLDLFVGGRVVPGNYPTTPQSFVFQNNGGQYTDVTTQIAPAFQNIGMVTDIKFGDLNGDQVAEMVVVGEWMPVTVFSFDGNQYTNSKLAGVAGIRGWWNCVNLADVDLDGDLDVIAGNLGLNTRIKANPSEPLRIYTTDFDSNGSNDPIITYVNEGIEYPLARRESLLKQIAMVKLDYIFFEPYSTASVQEVFDPIKLSKASKLEANRMETTLFINEGGTFKIGELPGICQISPVNQILVEDFDGDGNPDILMAGNNFSTDVETGRYDANIGLVLLGDGTGKFSDTSASESGLSFNGEVRDLSLIQTSGGKKVLLVAFNSKPLEVYSLN